VPHVQEPQRTTNANAAQEPKNNESPWEIGAIILGSIFTGIIAVYAIRQFEESRRSSERQLRAYLSVVVGAGIYQERLKGLRFEARPIILNNGATPAYKVRFSAVARIIPDKLAATYEFKMPTMLPVSQASIGPKENRIMSAVYPRMIPDHRAKKVVLGDKIALWVWGVVEYEDAFEQPRYTQFCQRLDWRSDGKGAWTTFGRYDPRFGKST
jgi:hypothetical protein